MRRSLMLAVAVIALALPSIAFANHVPPSVTVPVGLAADVPELKAGDVRFIRNLQTGRGYAAVFGETKPFVRDGHKYLVASSTHYGLSVIDVTDPLAPVVVSEYSSAFACPTAAAEATAEGHPDFLAPVGGWENDLAMTPDGKIAVLGMDAGGRCHDPNMGGIELVDLSDVLNPRTLHLTRNVGEAHSVTVDPSRPWLAYLSTSDGSDFIEIVDFRSCLGGVAQIAACKPVTGRIVLQKEFLPGLRHPTDNERDLAPEGCHDLRFRGDRAYCAAIVSTLILDVSGVVGADGNLTGTHLACELVGANFRAEGVKVTDCGAFSERVFQERKLTPVNARLVSVIPHDEDKPPTENIEIAHQAEATSDGTMMFITDERGGGLLGRQCPGGGVWFYDIRDEANPRLLKQADGSPGVFFPAQSVPGVLSCTAHYGGQVGDENLFVFAWYLNGTVAFRAVPDFAAGTIEFQEVAHYVPAAGWTIHSMGMQRNPGDPSELLIYTADAARGVDVLGVTAPKQALRSSSSGSSDGSEVRGNRVSRDLPRTGAPDAVTVGALMVVAATALWNRRRRILAE